MRHKEHAWKSDEVPLKLVPVWLKTSSVPRNQRVLIAARAIGWDVDGSLR